MTKDEKRYYKEIYKKLNPDYKQVYSDLKIRLSFATFCSMNVEEILFDVLEIFYNHQLMGEPVEKVLGKNKEKFFSEIIKAYYAEKLNKVCMIKNSIWITLLFTSGCMILSFIEGSTSILALLAIPIGFVLTLIWYFINRYVNNTILRNILTFGTMGIFMSRFIILMKEYKNIQPLSKLNFLFIIVIFIGIITLCIKKSYRAYSVKE